MSGSAGHHLWWNDTGCIAPEEEIKPPPSPPANTPGHKSGGAGATNTEWWQYQPILTRPPATRHVLVVLADAVGELDRPPLDDASVHTLNLIMAWIRGGFTVHVISPHRPQCYDKYPPRLQPVRHERCRYHSVDVVLRQVVPGNLSLAKAWTEDRWCEPAFFLTVVQHLCHAHEISFVFMRDGFSSHPQRRYAEPLLRSRLAGAVRMAVCGCNPFTQGEHRDPAELVRSYGATPMAMLAPPLSSGAEGGGPERSWWCPPLVREAMERPRERPLKGPYRIVYSGSSHSEYVWWLPRLALAALQLREQGAELELWLVFHGSSQSDAFNKMEQSLRSLPFVKWRVAPSLNQRLRIYEEADLGVMVSSSSRLSPQHHDKVAAAALAPHQRLYPQKDVLRLRQLASERMRRLSGEYSVPATLVEMGSRGLPVLLDRTPAHQQVAGHQYPLYLADANMRTFREALQRTLQLGGKGGEGGAGRYAAASAQLLASVRRDYTIEAQVRRFKVLADENNTALLRSSNDHTSGR